MRQKNLKIQVLEVLKKGLHDEQFTAKYKYRFKTRDISIECKAYIISVAREIRWLRCQSLIDIETIDKLHGIYEFKVKGKKYNNEAIEKTLDDAIKYVYGLRKQRTKGIRELLNAVNIGNLPEASRTA